MKPICPICKQSNFFKLVSNCKENIRLTEKSYSYGECLNCKIISLFPIPDMPTISRHYEFLNKEKEKNIANKKILPLLFKIKDYYKNKKNIKNILRNILKFGEEDFPYFNKLWNLNQSSTIRSDRHENIVIIRLADIYLMAAEAENELHL